MWFGCHLTLNEIYEKIFMLLWFWQVFLMIWTVFVLIYNFPFTFFFKWRLRLVNISRFNKYYPYKDCVRSMSLDDAFALSSVSCLLLGKDYAKLLGSLTIRKADRHSELNDTMYYDDESPSKNQTPKGSTTFDRTMYHSCEREPSDKDMKNTIGFEALGCSPNLTSKFNQRYSSSGNLSSGKSSMESFAWKKSGSLDFDDSFIRKGNLDDKLRPLTKHVRNSDRMADSNDFNCTTPKDERSFCNRLTSSLTSSSKKNIENSSSDDDDDRTEQPTLPIGKVMNIIGKKKSGKKNNSFFNEKRKGASALDEPDWLEDKEKDSPSAPNRSIINDDNFHDANDAPAPSAPEPDDEVIGFASSGTKNSRKTRKPKK